MRQFILSGLFILAALLWAAGGDVQAVGHRTPRGGEGAPVQLVGQLGGSTLAVAIRSPYVVAGIGQRLAVFDTTDTGHMQMLGQTELLPGVVADIALQGDYAYVADRSGGLQVVDVSQPQQPRAVGAFRMAGDVVRVAIVAPYAYILNTQLGLRVLDISDPTHPQRVGAFTDLKQPSQLKIVGNRLYIAEGAEYLLVLDRSDPRDLHLLARLLTSFLYISDFAIADNIVYMVGIDDWAESYFVIYDISDLHHVRRLSIQSLPGAYALSIQQDLAYITAGWGGLSVWDVSDVSHPVEISNYRENQAGHYRLQIAGHSLVVSQANDGIELFALSQNGVPSLLGQYRTLGAAWAIDTYDHYLYSYLGRDRVAIIDVADSNHPVLAGTFGSAHWSSGSFVIQDSLAYVATMNEGVQIFDLTWPLSPRLVASISTGYPYTIFTASSRFYLWNSTGIHIYDTSAPANVDLIASILPQFVYGKLFVDNNQLYVTHGLHGLEIYDLSDLADVKLLGSVDTLGNAGNLLVYNGYVFIDDGGDIVIIDARDPQHPFLATTIDPPGDIVDMAYESPYLYITSTGFYSDPQGTGGLMIFDVSTPTLPRQRAHVTLFPGITDVEVRGDALYMSTISSGITIYQQSLAESTLINWLPRLRRP